MKISKHSRYAATPALLAMSLLAGCGGSAFTKEDLDQTRNAVAQAEQSGIDKSGAVDLETAKNKVSQADKALEEGNEEQAERLANEARVDAEFAVAVSRAQSAQRAAQDLSAGVETLRRETERSQDAGSLTSPPAVAPAAPPAPLAPPQPPASRGQ
jgi:hypothetical protein